MISTCQSHADHLLRCLAVLSALKHGVICNAAMPDSHIVNLSVCCFVREPPSPVDPFDPRSYEINIIEEQIERIKLPESASREMEMEEGPPSKVYMFLLSCIV